LSAILLVDVSCIFGTTNYPYNFVNLHLPKDKLLLQAYSKLNFVGGFIGLRMSQVVFAQDKLLSRTFVNFAL
jgi:hypothetical protein